MINKCFWNIINFFIYGLEYFWMFIVKGRFFIVLVLFIFYFKEKKLFGYSGVCF